MSRSAFTKMAKGLEQIPEGGERCFRCYPPAASGDGPDGPGRRLRLFHHDPFHQPLKNAQKLNEIGARLAEEYGVPYLFSDFKKRNGYKRSTELSAEYGLYRQDYCGCVYSLRERRK